MRDEEGGRPLVATRRAHIERLLNEIIDPCSLGVGVPLGLKDMGMIDVHVSDQGEIRVELTPTFPGCLYLGHLEHRIRESLGTVGWCSRSVVDVVVGDDVWDEGRMTPEGKRRLRRKRKLEASSLPPLATRRPLPVIKVNPAPVSVEDDEVS